MNPKKRSIWNPFSRSRSASRNSTPGHGSISHDIVNQYPLQNYNAHINNQQIVINQQSSAGPSYVQERNAPARRDILGLTCLYDGTDPRLGVPIAHQVPVDIVAVHGLNGKSHTTWTAQAQVLGEVNWIRDFLPMEFPGSRIYTFGYNADLFWSRGTGDISSFAQELLLPLMEERRRREQKRPIIFISHSMGGLVVKKALNDCYRDRRPEYRDILNSVKSIFFFATPHRGAAIANFMTDLAAVINTITINSRTVKISAIRALQRDSDQLYQIASDFTVLTPRYKAYSFQEQLKTKKLNKLIVMQADAVLMVDNEQRIPMAGYDHRDIVRFKHKDESGYRLARGFLHEAVRTALNLYIEQIKEEDEPCLQSLSFPELATRLHDIETHSHNATTNRSWLVNHKTYQEWFSTSTRMLWLKGNPGTGKSTLMASIQHEVDTHFKGQSKCISFFFDRGGSTLQKTQLGMFRSLLQQLYRRSIVARTMILKALEEKQKSFGEAGKDWEWQLAELETLFSEVLGVASQQTEFIVLIDALDEASEEDEGRDKVAQRLVGYFHQLNEKIQQAEGRVKICISCRHYPNVKIGEALEIVVEAENEEAIRAYVKRELEAHVEGWEDQSEGARDDIVEMVVQKADRQFLWASIRVPKVIECLNDGTHSFGTIYQVLEAESSKLSDLYQNALTHDVHVRLRLRAVQLLRWILLAQQPLQLIEIRYALASEDIQSQQLVRCENSTSFVESDERMEKLTKSMSGGLAIVSSFEGRKYVRFIHQSVYEYLVQGGLASLFPNQEPIHDILGDNHDRLGRACVSYLTSANVLIGIGEWERGDERLFPFIVYAAKFWRRHAAKAEGYGKSQEAYIDIFTSTPIHLVYLAKIHDELVRRVWPYELRIGSSLLSIAASSGIRSIVERLLSTGVLADDMTQDVTALHCAARWGYAEIVRLLLDAGANAGLKTSSGKTAVELAAANSHMDVVQLLLREDDNVEQSTTYSDVLNAAAGTGNIAMLKFLVENGADINRKANNGVTAMYEASFNRQAEAVKYLFAQGADINATGGSYQSCLEAAAASLAIGDEPIVQFLIENGANVNPPSGIDDGPLMALIANPLAPIQAIEFMLRQKANVHISGKKFGSCLEAAAYRGDIDIVKMLLQHGADVNQLGQRGKSALHAAATTAWAEDIVWLLLENGADVHVKCKQGGGVLQAAAYSGTLAVAKKFLESGLDVNDIDDIHGHPLIAAASGPSGPLMVKLLLAHGAKIDAPGQKFGSALEAAIYFRHTTSVQALIDQGSNIRQNGLPRGEPPLSSLRNYRTFLQIAAMQGCIEIVEILLDHGVDINEPGLQYGNALQVAVFAGRVQVVELLLDRGALYNLAIADRCINIATGKKEMQHLLRTRRDKLLSISTHDEM